MAAGRSSPGPGRKNQLLAPGKAVGDFCRDRKKKPLAKTGYERAVIVPADAYPRAGLGEKVQNSPTSHDPALCFPSTPAMPWRSSKAGGRDGELRARGRLPLPASVISKSSGPVATAPGDVDAGHRIQAECGHALVDHAFRRRWLGKVDIESVVRGRSLHRIRRTWSKIGTVARGGTNGLKIVAGARGIAVGETGRGPLACEPGLIAT